MSDETAGDRLKQIRGSDSQDEFATKMNVVKGTIWRYERDERIPDGVFLKRLHELGFNPTWLLTGKGTARGGRVLVDEDGEIEIPPQPQTLGPDWALVRRYRVDLAAGGGAVAAEHISVDELAFRRQYLEFIGVSAKASAIMRVRGDSMESLLRDNDTVLIDTSDTTIQPPAREQSRRRAYAICQTGPGGEALRCKFVEQVRANGAEFTQIASCNPDFPPERVESDEIQVLGRIRWAGRTWF